MAIEAAEKKDSLESVANHIISQLQKEFPNAEYLINGEVYGDEDVDLEIYVPEEKVLEVDQFAHEVAFELTNGTGILILPMVVSKEYCSVKQ